MQLRYNFTLCYFFTTISCSKLLITQDVFLFRVEQCQEQVPSTQMQLISVCGATKKLMKCSTLHNMTCVTMAATLREFEMTDRNYKKIQNSNKKYPHKSCLRQMPSLKRVKTLSPKTNLI